jgi:hypothetical protein
VHYQQIDFHLLGGHNHLFVTIVIMQHI